MKPIAADGLVFSPPLPTGALAEWEFAHRLDTHERLVVRDGEGRIYAECPGSKHSITFPGWLPPLLTPGRVLSHVHPSGLAPAQQDINTAAFHELAEMRVTSPQGTFSVRSIDGLWADSLLRLYEVWYEIQDRLCARLDVDAASLSNAQLPLTEAARLVRWQTLAECAVIFHWEVQFNTWR